jgi:hypothetical protein
VPIPQGALIAGQSSWRAFCHALFVVSMKFSNCLCFQKRKGFVFLVVPFSAICFHEPGGFVFLQVLR